MRHLEVGPWPVDSTDLQAERLVERVGCEGGDGGLGRGVGPQLGTKPPAPPLAVSDYQLIL